MKTYEMLVKLYCVEAVSKKCVFEWFECFRNEKEYLKDEKCSGSTLYEQWCSHSVDLFSILLHSFSKTVADHMLVFILI